MTRARDPIVPQEGLGISEHDVEVRDGAVICVRSYRRASAADELLPLFIYMHGGGFVTGGLETDDSTCRAIAMAMAVTVVSAEYRLAPENPFPTGFEDCMDIVRWVCLCREEPSAQTSDILPPGHD
jgi:acetyl esterase/lipase